MFSWSSAHSTAALRSSALSWSLVRLVYSIQATSTAVSWHAGERHRHGHGGWMRRRHAHGNACTVCGDAATARRAPRPHLVKGAIHAAIEVGREQLVRARVTALVARQQ